MEEHADASVADRHADLFPLTSEERARIDAAPFRNDPEHWKWFAGAAMPSLLESYASGQMELRPMLATMRGCALGCPTSARLMLLGMLSERALTITPAQARTKEYPVALQALAASLVDFLRQERTNEKLQTILDESIKWLVTIGICDNADPIHTGTLKKWYLDRKRAAGDPIARGRPRDRA